MKPNMKLWLFEITIEEAYRAYEKDGIIFKLGKSSLQLPRPFDATNLFVTTEKEE